MSLNILATIKEIERGKGIQPQDIYNWRTLNPYKFYTMYTLKFETFQLLLGVRVLHRWNFSSSDFAALLFLLNPLMQIEPEKEVNKNIFEQVILTSNTNIFSTSWNK